MYVIHREYCIFSKGTRARHDHLVASPLTNMRIRAFIDEHQPVGIDIALCRKSHNRLGEQTIRN